MWGDKMKVFWFGHAFFKIVIDDKIICIDPYDESIGYIAPKDISCDILLETHQHHDHNNESIIHGKYYLIKESGKFNFENISVEGLGTYHDNVMGNKRGENISFIIKSLKYKIVHLGDLGCIPSDEIINKISEADILMIPIGGVYTIDKDIAFSLVERIKPRVVIPMHYKTEKLKFDLDRVDGFIEKFNNVFYEEFLEINNSKDLIKYNGDLVVLEYFG